MHPYVTALFVAAALYFVGHWYAKTKASLHCFWIVPLLAVVFVIVGTVAAFFICAAFPECAARITMP